MTFLSIGVGRPDSHSTWVPSDVAWPCAERGRRPLRVMSTAHSTTAAATARPPPRLHVFPPGWFYTTHNTPCSPSGAESHTPRALCWCLDRRPRPHQQSTQRHAFSFNDPSFHSERLRGGFRWALSKRPHRLAHKPLPKHTAGILCSQTPVLAVCISHAGNFKIAIFWAAGFEAAEAAFCTLWRPEHAH